MERTRAENDALEQRQQREIDRRITRTREENARIEEVQQATIDRHVAYQALSKAPERVYDVRALSPKEYSYLMRVAKASNVEAILRDAFGRSF